MLSEHEVAEAVALRTRFQRMRAFRLSIILVYGVALLPIAAILLLTAETWLSDLRSMAPGLLLFLGSFAVFAGFITLRSEQYQRDRRRLHRLEKEFGSDLPWETQTPVEVTGRERDKR